MTQLIARVEIDGRPIAGDVEQDRFYPRHGEVPLLGARTGESFPLASLRLLPPVAPGKIVAVALNYRTHAAEMGKAPPAEPLFFLKPPSAVIGPGETIRLPKESALVHHEAELGLVVGRRLTRATVDEAREAIFGVTGVIDVTARDLQRAQGHYTRAKGYDTFCPLGPMIARGLDPADLGLTLRVNGEVRQLGRTSDQIFGPYALVAFISRVMTLVPGDVVSTGTPAGVGPLVDGDRVELEVEGAGVLELEVEGASGSAQP